MKKYLAIAIAVLIMVLSMSFALAESATPTVAPEKTPSPAANTGDATASSDSGSDDSDDSSSSSTTTATAPVVVTEEEETDEEKLASYQAQYAGNPEAVKADYVDEVVAAMAKPSLVESKSSKFATVSSADKTASINIDELKTIQEDDLENKKVVVFVTYIGADGKLVRKSVKYKVVDGKLVIDLPEELAESGKPYNIDVVIDKGE